MPEDEKIWSWTLPATLTTLELCPKAQLSFWHLGSEFGFPLEQCKVWRNRILPRPGAEEPQTINYGQVSLSFL